jgi:hypothetical protein
MIKFVASMVTMMQQYGWSPLRMMGMTISTIKAGRGCELAVGDTIIGAKELGALWAFLLSLDTYIPSDLP